jgi:hypothetical protein
MNYPLMILGGVGAIGAVDVLYYHLYRFRLFAQASSGGEEFGMGLAVASYVFVRRELPLPVPAGMLAWQVRGMLAAGLLLVVVEMSLFARAVAQRHVQGAARVRPRGIVESVERCDAAGLRARPLAHDRPGSPARGCLAGRVDPFP